MEHDEERDPRLIQRGNWVRWVRSPRLKTVHETRVAAILHPLLFLLILTTAVMLISNIFVLWIPSFQSFMLVAILLGFIGLYVFLRRGGLVFVSWATISLVMASGIVSSILDVTDSIYPLPFIIGVALAGLTLGSKSPLLLAIGSAGWLGVLNFGHRAGWYVLNRPTEDPGVIISQLFLVVLMGATMTVANIALARAFEIIDQKEEARRRLESNLFQAQKIDAIGRLAGGFAHDFNNLLGVVMVNADFLREEQLSPEGQQSVDDIFIASQSGSVLTSKMLALGRKQVVQSRVLDPTPLIKDFASMLGHMAGRNISVELTCDEDLGHIKVDPNQLQQILSNLVINASHASKAGDVIHVRMICKHLNKSFVGIPDQVSPGDYLCLKVTDNGTGMNEETLTSAFEPFFTTKSMEHGSGLGLSVVLGVVRQSGGRITVKTQLGEGTEFCLWFPVVHVAETWRPTSIKTEASTVSLAHLVDAKVVFVDDDNALRSGVTQVLKNAGTLTYEFANGKAALAHICGDGGFPDLLLTDVMMPEMTGPELVIQMQAQGYKGPVVYISGYAGSEKMQHYLDQADLVLRKPISSMDLLASLNQCLARETDR